MSTCQMFNAEVCYGSGLVYDTELATAQVQTQVDDFMQDNDLAKYQMPTFIDIVNNIRSAKGNI